MFESEPRFALTCWRLRAVKELIFATDDARLGAEISIDARVPAKMMKQSDRERVALQGFGSCSSSRVGFAAAMRRGHGISPKLSVCIHLDCRLARTNVYGCSDAMREIGVWRRVWASGSVCDLRARYSCGGEGTIAD